MRRAVVLAALLTACAEAPPPRAGAEPVARARRAEAAGRHAEAVRAYDQASTEAQNDKDRSMYALAAAREAERSGDIESAQRRYEAMAHLQLPDAPIALMRLAAMRMVVGDLPAAQAFWSEILRAHPHSGSALRALTLYVGDSKDADYCASRLLEVQSFVDAGQDLALREQHRYMVAQCRDIRGQGREALALYLGVANDFPAPGGHFFHESLLRAAELQQSYGDDAAAVATLQRLLAEREHSSTLGSYEKPSYAIAQARLATIYDQRLHQNDAARLAWVSLFENFPDSKLRDDGAFEAALMEKRRGDLQAACGWLAKLQATQPTSRFVRCIPAWCSSVPATACAASYLQERWDSAVAKK